MIHEMKLKDVYFEKIKSGEKIYEIRLNDGKRKLIDVGDIIVFRKTSNLNEKLTTRVEDLIYFKTFTEMINTLPKEKVGFKKENPIEIVDIYHQFYSKGEEDKFGVLAIKVKFLKTGATICNN